MKKVELNIPLEILILDYLELNSSYKVAKKYNISATAVKRILKNARVLRTQSDAASKRNNVSLGKYKRTESHKQHLSTLAKQRYGSNNPFFGKTHTDENKQKFSENAKKSIGKQNPNFKNGLYFRRPRDYKIHELTKLRNFIFNRDKFTCKYCTQIGGNLHAHHILPYWVKLEAFLDKDNLITVCSSCHFKKAHKNNWKMFDTSLITDILITKYSLDCERLNELATFIVDAKV